MADIIISKDDLNNPAIDDMVNLQKSLAPKGGEKIADIKTPFFYNPIFYYTVAAIIGSIAVWAATEPFINDKDETSVFFVSDYCLFGPVAAVLGLSIGLVYGIVNRNLKKTLYCGIVGIGVGLAVTVVTTIIADLFFSITMHLVLLPMLMANPPKKGEYPFHGMIFIVQMCRRAIAWSIVSTGAGLGLGIALKSKKLVLNGFVGGMIGGLLGGMAFDPTERFISFHNNDSGGLCRLIALVAVGSLVGFFIGLFENLSKEAWFQMLKGPLAGKQFIIFKSPMFIGSSPKADVYLFKDADIAPQHASITKAGSKYLLKDEGSDKGTFVNGKKVDKYILQHADTITIGEAVLRYSEKTKGV